MNKSIAKLAGAIFLLGSVAVAQDVAQQGLSISRKADTFNNGYASETSTMEMVLINAHGDRTTRKMKSQQIETKADGDRSRIEFQWPADVKGTRMLTWTHKQNNDDQWLYLPAIRRVKRISSGNRSGSFMGSEFAYEDLGSQEVEKYHHKLLGEEKLNGRDTWKLERTPVDKESGYSHLDSWLDKQYMQPLKVDYFDRKGELLKTATFRDYVKHGKWYRASSIKMVNHQTKKQSVLSWSERKLGVKLRAKKFESDELAD